MRMMKSTSLVDVSQVQKKLREIVLTGDYYNRIQGAGRKLRMTMSRTSRPERQHAAVALNQYHM